LVTARLQIRIVQQTLPRFHHAARTFGKMTMPISAVNRGELCSVP